MKTQLTQALQLDASESMSVSVHSLLGRVSLLSVPLSQDFSAQIKTCFKKLGNPGSMPSFSVVYFYFINKMQFWNGVSQLYWQLVGRKCTFRSSHIGRSPTEPNVRIHFFPMQCYILILFMSVWHIRPLFPMPPQYNAVMPFKKNHTIFIFVSQFTHSLRNEAKT